MKTIEVPFVIGDIIGTWRWRREKRKGTKCKECGALSTSPNSMNRFTFEGKIISIFIEDDDHDVPLQYRVIDSNGSELISVPEEMFATQKELLDRIAELEEKETKDKLAMKEIL